MLPWALDGRIAPPAFIAPQRGGVVIYNPPAPAHEQPPSVALDAPTWDLLPSFLTFEEQFRALLGLEPGSHARRGLSREELDALARRRLREATEDTVETLLATVRLAREIQNMQINGDVQGRIYRALDRLDEVSLAEVSALAVIGYRLTLDLTSPRRPPRARPPSKPCTTSPQPKRSPPAPTLTRR